MSQRIEPHTVVVGMLGPVLDRGAEATRWEQWRPSVAVCMQEDLLVHRYELIHQRPFRRLAATVADDIRSVSPETEVTLHPVDLTDPWDFEEVYATLYDFSRGLSLNQETHELLVHITTGTHVAQICLFLLTESRHLPGKLLQTSPAPGRRNNDPAGRHAVIDLDLSRYDLLAQRFARDADDDVAFLKGGIETRNRAFNDLVDQIERVAIRSREPILLTGPTGAGKTRLARRIYQLKRLRGHLTGRLVEVNCATLRGDMALSTLFGHRRGAFTGATTHRAGLLQAAHQGLLFLDEVGELGLDEQAMLLHAIEEGMFLPMGADPDQGEVTSDFQLICGTNRDLSRAVARGRFREDLLARIDLWTFALPGLRQRPEDIAPNLDHELEQVAARTSRAVSFNREARDRFLAFACSDQATWSGNFRDLIGAVTRMATLCPRGRITEEVVDGEIARLRRSWSRGRGGAGRGEEALLLRLLGPDRLAALDRFDRPQLAEVARACAAAPSLSAAGRALFDVSRTRRRTRNDADRLRKYLARHGLSWEEVKEATELPD